MSITYEEALETLNSMFGSPWNTESLDTVLRHFEGHMENTIEAILGHGDGAPEDLIRRLASGGDGGPSSSTSPSSTPSANPGGVDISVDEEIARSLAAEEEQNSRRRPAGGGGGAGAGRSSGAGTGSGGGGGAAPKKQRGRGTPAQLPPDFLRIPGYKHRSTVGSSAGQAAFGGGGIEDDERLARMLQDEMLQQELANNAEFSHLSSFGRANAARSSTLAESLRSSGFGGVGGRPGGTAGGGVEGPNIMEKLSDMGEQAKKRLAMFASQFNQQNGAGGGGGFGSGFGAGNNRYFGATPERNTAQQERRGLLDDNEDDGNIGDELSFGGTGPGAAGINSRGPSGRDVEMRNMGGGGPANKKMD